MALSGLLWLLLITDSRASIFQLANMITTFTGKDWSSYATYGCYCGAGNAGTNVTLDCSDACCEAHDAGYGELIDSSCDPYWDEYRITTSPLSCVDDIGTCARRLCECDVTLTRCLAQWSHTFKQVFIGSRYSYCTRPEKNIDKSQCDYDQGTTAKPIAEPAVSWSLKHVAEIGNAGTEGRLGSTPKPWLLVTDTVSHSNTLQSNSEDGTHGHIYADVGGANSTVQPVNLVSHVVPHSTTVPNKAEEKIADSPHVDHGREQQPSLCSSLPSACRQFSFAELLTWITVVTVAYLVGSLLFFYGGVIVGRRKEELHCDATSSCCCCAAGQAIRYKKLHSGAETADTLTEL